MSSQTKKKNGGISWTEETWNPIRGCSRVSEGCRNCYAETQAARFCGPGQPYEGLIAIGEKGPRWNGQIKFVYDQLHKPIHWRRPRMVFVNSMSDLFHPNLSDEDRDQIFATMLACEVLAPRKDFAPGLGHTFQVLTKRPEEMRRYLSADPVELVKRWGRAGDHHIHVDDGNVMFSEVVESAASYRTEADGVRIVESRPWGFVDQIFPLRNVWLGVSVENQETAEARIPDLLATPAAVRWVSYEPAIGPVDFTMIRSKDGDAHHVWDVMRGRGLWTWGKGEDANCTGWGKERHLDWIVVGGESGPGARPFDLEWARAVVRQSRDTPCRVFVKQLGSNPNPGIVAGRDPSKPLLKDRKGGDMSEWAEDLRVREWPESRHG